MTTGAFGPRTVESVRSGLAHGLLDLLSLGGVVRRAGSVLARLLGVAELERLLVDLVVGRRRGGAWYFSM